MKKRKLKQQITMEKLWGISNSGGVMKLFELHRNEDETGVSGTGVVAQGVIFARGKVALSWLTSVSSVAVYDSIEDVVKIHGHEGKTRVVQVLSFDREQIREKYTNFQQDDIEGVDASMLAAGGNQAYMVHQRGWWALLFRQVEIKQPGVSPALQAGDEGSEDTETTAAEAKQADIDDGLPVRTGDVWWHRLLGERGACERLCSGWRMTQDPNGSPVYMFDDYQERGDWIFVRRGQPGVSPALQAADDEFEAHISKEINGTLEQNKIRGKR